MSAYKYSWTKRYSVKAQIVGEIIEKLPDRSAESLVKEARKSSSPIHSLFEWDNTRAAQEYRLLQARVMIASLRVEVISEDRKPQQVSAFVSRANKSETYVPTLEADDDDLSAAESRCYQQMQSFREKWKGLQFARTVIDAISDIDRSVKRKRGRKAA